MRDNRVARPLAPRDGETLMKQLLPVLLLLLMGCEDLSTMTSESRREVAPESVGVTMEDAESPQPPQKPAAEQPEAPASAPAAKPEPTKPTHFQKRVAQLVDKNQALKENPELILVKNEMKAGDPLTAIAQGYFAAASMAHIAALQHEVDLQRALNDKAPTFAEFKGMFDRHGIQLKGLYEWQMYAYDDQTGTMSILEDTAMKRRMKEAAGIELPED